MRKNKCDTKTSNDSDVAATRERSLQEGTFLMNTLLCIEHIKHTKVIMVTARGQALDYEAGMSRGASAYIIKPFSPVQLVNIIKDLVT